MDTGRNSGVEERLLRQPTPDNGPSPRFRLLHVKRRSAGVSHGSYTAPERTPVIKRLKYEAVDIPYGVRKQGYRVGACQIGLKLSTQCPSSHLKSLLTAPRAIIAIAPFTAFCVNRCLKLG